MGLSRRKLTREYKLAAGISHTAGDGVSGRASVETGAQDRTGAGDRSFELVPSAYRGVAETAGTGLEGRCLPEIEIPKEGAEALPVKRMCILAGVGRAGFYCFPSGVSAPADADIELHDTIQRMTLEFPSYGWPRVTVKLKRRGKRPAR